MTGTQETQEKYFVFFTAVSNPAAQLLHKKIYISIIWFGEINFSMSVIAVISHSRIRMLLFQTIIDFYCHS